MSNLTAMLNGLWNDVRDEPSENSDDETANKSYRMISEAFASIVHFNKTLVEFGYPNLRISLENFLKKFVYFFSTKSGTDTEICRSFFVFQGFGKVERNAATFRHPFEFHVRSIGQKSGHQQKQNVGTSGSEKLADRRWNLFCAQLVGLRCTVENCSREKVSRHTRIGTRTRLCHLFFVIIRMMKCWSGFFQLYLFVKEYAIFFRKGYLFFNEKPEIRLEDLNEFVDVSKNRVKSVERKMQDRHAIVPKVSAKIF